MPWNWGAKTTQSIEVGGSRGSVNEAYSTQSWPNYNAAYLAKRLGHERPTDAYANRYAAADGIDDPAAKAVYLDKVTANYRSEADECLKNEFVDWLQGTHEANEARYPYPNRPGQPTRRYVSGPKSGQPMDDWNPTWWGKNQLTHLDGVRPFLREMKTSAEGHELNMNLLAEYGPNNLDQAWAYFKHWVKGRPIAPEECIHESTPDDTVHRSAPTHMGQSRSEMTDPLYLPTRAQAQQNANAAANNAANMAAAAAQATSAAQNAAAAAAAGTIPVGVASAAAQVAQDAGAQFTQSVHQANQAAQTATQAQQAAAAAAAQNIASAPPDPVAANDPNGAYLSDADARLRHRRRSTATPRAERGRQDRRRNIDAFRDFQKQLNRINRSIPTVAATQLGVERAVNEGEVTNARMEQVLTQQIDAAVQDASDEEIDEVGDVRFRGEADMSASNAVRQRTGDEWGSDPSQRLAAVEQAIRRAPYIYPTAPPGASPFYAAMMQGGS